MHNKQRVKGFTLIELSIVLVIIGLLIGGIVIGSSIVKAANLRSVITEIGNYKTSVITFRTTYNQLPGDFNGATSFWPTNSWVINDGNGNNNGLINDVSSTNQALESLMVWLHLQLAGIINGNFTGSNHGYALGTDVAASKFGKNTGYQTAYNVVYGLGPINRLTLGTNTPASAFGSGAITSYSAMAAVDAYGIDVKLDDGLPAAGKVMGYTGYDIVGYADNDSLCGLGTIPSRSYNVLNSSIYCYLIFNDIFG